MNVITTQDYVAGIFANWTDAQAYIGLKPEYIRGFLHTNSDLTYPFYLVQTGRVFVGCQTIEDVRRQAVGIIVFTITEDYQPHVPWNDEMALQFYSVWEGM